MIHLFLYVKGLDNEPYPVTVDQENEIPRLIEKHVENRLRGRILSDEWFALIKSIKTCAVLTHEQYIRGYRTKMLDSNFDYSCVGRLVKIDVYLTPVVRVVDPSEAKISLGCEE